MTTGTRIQIGWQTVVEPMPFNGVPCDLVKAVQLYHTGRGDHSGWGKYAFTPGMFPVEVINDNPDQNRDITAEIKDDDRIAIITVSKHPTGVFLYVESFEQDWVILAKSWLAFREFLEEEGWIGNKPTANQAPMPQSLASTAAPKTTRWTVDRIALVVAIAACIAAWLVVPQVQEVVRIFVHSATPTLTPTLVPPTPTP